jgi:hypothetical protein
MPKSRRLEFNQASQQLTHTKAVVAEKISKTVSNSSEL